MQSFFAITNPARRRIVELHAVQERIAGEMIIEFDLGAPALCQHLNMLGEAGLITTRADGQSRIQALNPDGFDDLEDWLQKIRLVWSRGLDALERELRAEDAANEGRQEKEVVVTKPVQAVVLHRFSVSVERIFWFRAAELNLRTHINLQRQSRL